MLKKDVERDLINAFLRFNSLLRDIKCELEKHTDLLSSIARHQLLLSPTTESDWLLTLPKHLQVTWCTLRKLGEATASEIAAITNRARAVESAYLNQLVIMTVVSKKRKGRKAYFYPIMREDQKNV